jgi:hypothetical protein
MAIPKYSAQQSLSLSPFRVGGCTMLPEGEQAKMLMGRRSLQFDHRRSPEMSV